MDSSRNENFENALTFNVIFMKTGISGKKTSINFFKIKYFEKTFTLFRPIPWIITQNPFQAIRKRNALILIQNLRRIP